MIDVNTGICWHCYDYKITLISDFPEGVYNIENCKKMDTEKKVISGSKKLLLMVYIRTRRRCDLLLGIIDGGNIGEGGTVTTMWHSRQAGQSGQVTTDGMGRIRDIHD